MHSSPRIVEAIEDVKEEEERRSPASWDFELTTTRQAGWTEAKSCS